MPDTLLPFLFEASDVRGAMVDLDSTWRQVLANRDYPLPVRGLLGEAMAAAALLSSTLKFNGTLVLQTRAADPGAPVRVMVVECNAALEMRATATLGGDVPEAGAHSLASLVGNGSLVITLDPRDGQEAYQGVVALEGEHLSVALENYMMRSEQLDTRIHLAADATRAAGLLVQRMPGDGGSGYAASTWEDAAVLARTLTRDELLGLEPRQVLRRLFHAHDLRLFDERGTAFRCSCSRQRVSDMLKMLGREEIDSIIADEGKVSVDCEFCHQVYAFDPIDAAQLFIAGVRPASDARH
jgi:molecular chaperone Hsp33